MALEDFEISSQKKTYAKTFRSLLFRVPILITINRESMWKFIYENENL